MSNFNRGSEWKKWDLHCHTPLDHDWINKPNLNSNEDKENFAKEYINFAKEQNLSVIAITDHNFCSSMESLLIPYIQKEAEEKDITVLPGFEITAKDGSGIHLLIIFKERTDLSKIHETVKACFPPGTELCPSSGVPVSELSVSEIKNKVNSSKLDSIFIFAHADSKSGILDKKTIDGTRRVDEWNNKNVNICQLSKSINSFNSGTFLNHLYKGKVPLYKREMTYIIASDCRTIKIEDTTEGRFYLGQKFVWIKAEPTFEGLKQTIYEPESRVYIGDIPPSGAVHKLDKLTLAFHKNTTWENNKFCFNGKHEFIFSPYFTCIIGGRGSGKSTLVNLIAERNGTKQDALKAIKYEYGQSLENSVTFEPTSIFNLEYLAQNTIEEFAKDSKKFTSAIFERINKSSNETLSQLESKLNIKLSEIDEQIKRHKTRYTLHKELINLQQELNAKKEIIKTFNDTNYISNKKDISSIEIKLSTYRTSEKKYNNLLNILKDANKKEKVEEVNNYDKVYNDLLADINKLVNKSQSIDLTEDVDKQKILIFEKSGKLDEITKFLKSKNLSDENINDVANASSEIESLKEVRRIKSAELINLKRTIKNFNFNNIDILQKLYQDAINIELEKINQKFRTIQTANSDDVKLINVQYKLDAYINYQVMAKLNHKLGINQSERSTFYDYLFRISFEEVLKLDYKTFIQNLTPKCNSGTQAFKEIKNIFENQLNFKIYQLVIQQSLYDFKTNKILKVLYDSKSLEQSSFGQRCTAAIVILLSLGNNPIIIDEPEAHLDSSLIANYLVELIKEQKQHRQIIFATHNANFVINADAELIIKLENNKGLTTNKTFTIESLENREDLLKLEGGAIAFKKREQKYNI